MKTMTKKAIFTLLIMLIANGFMFANGTDPIKETANIKKISGQVIDQVTGETLAGVKVFIQGTDKVVYTDFDGEFEIAVDLGKEEQISVSMISYDVQTFKVSDIENRKLKLERQK